MQNRFSILRTLAVLFVFSVLLWHESPSCATSAQTVTASQQTTITSATPANTRRNLGLFFEKLRANKTVTIAFFGGTHAAALEARIPYRLHVLNWLKQQYPQARFNEINAAVANTGTAYAALRARRDVIAYKPDLVFLDLALPESQEAPATEENYKKALEGLLRQMLIVPQPPEIVLLHAANAQRTARIEWSETIAAHYQLPTLNLQAEAWKLIESGQLKATAFGKDGNSANDEVHRAYGQQLTTFLAAQAEQTPTPLLRNLPNPLVSDEMNYGEFKALAEIKHSSLWKTENNNDRALPAVLLTSDKAAVTLDVFFDGTVLGITFQAGPQGGTFECLIDGKPAPAPLTKVDAYAPTLQLQTRIIPGGLPQGEHKLTIRVTNEKNQKSAGNQIKLGAMLVGGQRPEKL